MTETSPAPIILGINGSPRAGDVTGLLVQAALDASLAVDERLQVRRIDLADHRIQGCIDCAGCIDYGRCGINDDFNSLLPVLSDPAVIAVIVASPAHLGSMTAQCKAFLDRTQLLQRNGGLWRGRVGAGIAVGPGPGCGQELTLQCLHAALLYHDMVVVQAGGVETLSLDGACVALTDAAETPPLALSGIERLGRRVAETALRLR